MNDPIFNNLMKHTCDIEQTAVTASSDETYGHVVIQKSVRVKVRVQIPCRLTSLSVQEMERRGLAPTMSGSYGLHIHYRNLPDGLSMTEGSATFMVTNVRNRDGSLYDSGPFDITSIMDAAGESHHAKLQLTRVTSAVTEGA